MSPIAMPRRSPSLARAHALREAARPRTVADQARITVRRGARGRVPTMLRKTARTQ